MIIIHSMSFSKPIPDSTLEEEAVMNWLEDQFLIHVLLSVAQREMEMGESKG